MTLDRDAVFKQLQAIGGRLTPGIDWSLKLPALRALIRDGDTLSVLGQSLETKALIEAEMSEGNTAPELTDLLQLIERDIRPHV